MGKLMGLPNQQAGLAALNGGLLGLQGLVSISNQLGDDSEYQKLLEHAQNFSVAGQPIVKMEGRLTRFDHSTKTRVPVTQEWVDEAVAEIVRLNVELSGISGQVLGVAEPDALKVDRIWEAVRAASAV